MKSMFGKLKVIFILVQPLIIFWGCQVFSPSKDVQQTMEIDQSKHNQSISVAARDTITVVLNEVPTSGYRWELEDYQKDLIQFVGDEYQSGSHSGIGGGGKHYFKFFTAKEGKVSLSFVNKQQWEGGEIDDRFIVHLVVQ